MWISLDLDERAKRIRVKLFSPIYCSILQQFLITIIQHLAQIKIFFPRKFEKGRGRGRTMANKKALCPIIAWNNDPHVPKIKSD